jgi:hypothetical protein
VTLASPVGTHRVQPWWSSACVWWAFVFVRCFGSCTQVVALVAQAGMPADVSCAYSSGAVGCCGYARLSFDRRGVVHWSTDIGVHRRCRLLLNRVQWPVQDEWQGETHLRFRLRGLSAPPCARCCTRMRTRCTRLPISAATRVRKRMYELLLRVLAGYGHLYAGKAIFIN